MIDREVIADEITSFLSFELESKGLSFFLSFFIFFSFSFFFFASMFQVRRVMSVIGKLTDKTPDCREAKQVRKCNFNFIMMDSV